MSRAGYTDDMDDYWSWIRYRGAVRSAIRGRRGQAFLKEMLAALDALPEKRLITEDLVIDGENGGFIVGGDTLVAEHQGGMTSFLYGPALSTEAVEVCRVNDACALGAVALARGMKVGGIDPHDPCQVAPAFGIAEAMAREIAYENDEGGPRKETPEQRWHRVRAWVEASINDTEKSELHRKDRGVPGQDQE